MAGTRDNDAVPGRAPGVRRALMWKAIRLFGQRRATFTKEDLVVLVEDNARPTSLVDYQRYLQGLVRSGHLSVDKRTRVYRYRVRRDTGPVYPLLRHDGSVYDENDGSDTRLEVAS